MPTVSVIIPTFQRCDMVGDAVRSVLDQGYWDWEALIIDDGSTDGTRDVIETFDDPRIRYLYQENRGLARTRNRGIQAARGEFIAFLDSDDLFLPNKLQLQVAALRAQPQLSLVAGGYIEVDATLRPMREQRPWIETPALHYSDWLVSCPFPPSVPLIKRICLERAGLFDEGMQRIEDWDLWLRLAFLGCRMDWLHEPVSCYRYHSSNMIRDIGLMKVGLITMLDKFYALPDVPPDALALRGRAYGNAYLNAACRAYAAGSYVDGQTWLAEAIRWNPEYVTGQPVRLLDSLAGFAQTPLVEDADSFMCKVIKHLPVDVGLPHYTERQALGLLHAVRAFDAAKRQDRRHVLRQVGLAVLHDPGWLRHRGLLSIGRSALVGAFRPHPLLYSAAKDGAHS